VGAMMKVVVKHKKWWYRFMPKKRKELRISQLIISHITEKPEFQRKVYEQAAHEMIYGRTK
jgi:hypothetical protein